MRRFWGRNDQSSSPRFTRDDDQLLALNYENLCDGDYLLRLFVNDPFNNKESINGAMSEPNRNSASTNESSLLNPEIAEDIILFGDSIVLGKLFYHKRLQRELQQSNKFYDSVFLQISRQVMIFEHMALVMAKRCSEPLPSTAIAEGSVEVGHPPKSIAFATLGCCLRLVRSLGDWRLVNSAHLNAILKALLYFMDPSNAAFTHFGYDAESSGLFTEVRFIFMHCIKVLLSGEFLQHVEWNKSKFEEEIRLPMFGIFGLFAVSILTNSSEDMTIATGFLSMLVMLVEERSEKVLRRLKGDQLVAITATSNNNSNPKSFPSKVSSKVKRQLSGKAVSKGPFGSIATEEEVKPPGSSPRLEDRDAQDLSNNNDMQPKLQSHGSGTKLWDKSIASKVALEKDKDAAKKPTKSKQVPENAKLLHEILEPKDVVAVNPLANTVVNYVMEDSAPTAVAVHSNQFSNNDVSPARVHRAGANDPTSHALEIRRVEREIRDSIQSVLVLPKSVIAMLKSLGHSLSSQISSPGKKTLLANKSKEPANPVLTSCSTISSSRVYSCGQNSYGELGLGDVTMRKSFTRISSLDEKGVVSIGAGNEHSLFVTKEGKLITAGYNDNGQCGIGSTQQVRVPTVVQALEDEEIQHVYVYNGCEHTIAVTKEGKVYSFGYNYRGQVCCGVNRLMFALT